MMLQVSLEDLYNGKEYEVEISKQVICPKCRGSGAKDSNDVKKCDACQGRGIRIITQQIAPGFIQQVQTTCDKCNGKGKVIKAKCPICGGHKVIRDNEMLSIVVERGMANDHVILLEGESDQSPDHPPADIQIMLNTLKHERFERNGSDLHTEFEIPLLDALVGFSRTLIHLDNREVLLERDQVTPSGYVQLIEDEGMPTHELPSEKGNLYVKYKVIYPTVLDDSVKEALRELLK
ncbi:hypothetical protein K502DRAFT_119466 [Neoconidiobolus thromboides FSU 785]|nr:hypothetical protein K502DRAFT_119466 [Neoconidiobolus thromboides FSU 785]